MENILDLLYEYSKRGKNVDKEFMDKVIKVMIREKDLNDYMIISQKASRYDTMVLYEELVVCFE